MTAGRRLITLLAAALAAADHVRAEQTNAPASAAPTAITIETVATGLASPWALEFLPDGRMLVTERPGRLRVVDRTGVIGPPILGVPAVAAEGQGGLLDVALAPDYSTTGVIYLTFAEPRGNNKNGTSVARATLALDGSGGHLENVKVIFQQTPAIASPYHFGSRIAFGRDGSLFITTGERNFAKDQAQNPANHIGKIIHIAPDGSPAGGNPNRQGWDAKVWSIGHRNVQGAAVDPATGALWTVEHGARGGDELNRPEAGKNYGWPIITYGRDYTFLPIGVGTAKEGMEQPVYYWDPSIATSSLAFYTGNLFAGWNGNALVTGLRGAHLERLEIENDQVVAHEKLLEDFGERLREVREAPDGSVWIVTDNNTDGKLLRLTPKR